MSSAPNVADAPLHLEATISGQCRAKDEGRGADTSNPPRTGACLSGDHLTAEAQMAITCFHFWYAAVERLTAQWAATRRPAARLEAAGWVEESYPAFGDYQPFQYLIWAATLHADALMMKLGDPVAGGSG